MTGEAIFVLKKNNSVENYRKVEKLIDNLGAEMDVWGLSKAIKETKCQHRCIDAETKDGCDFVLMPEEKFIWVIGNLSVMYKEDILEWLEEDGATEEEKELLEWLEIGYANGRKTDFYENLEEWQVPMTEEEKVKIEEAFEEWKKLFE